MQYELSVAARKLIAERFSNFAIKYENIAFRPPANGAQWLKFDYIEVDDPYFGLSRTCRSHIGMVQVSVVFSPGSGIDKYRRLAQEIANYAEDGKMLEVGYISEGGRVHPVQKAEGGWFFPVRFYVRYD